MTVIIILFGWGPKTDKTARILKSYIETNKVKKERYLIRQDNILKEPKTSKTPSILNYIETNQVKKECYLIREDNILKGPKTRLEKNTI